MNSTLDTQFLQRATAIENDLLNLKHSAVGDFNRQWLAYVDDFKAALEAECSQGSLSSSTITTTYILANKVTKVIQTFLDLEALSEQLMSSLLEEETSPTTGDTNATSLPSPPKITESAGLPGYIRLAYQWLLENIHNPYPSIHIRHFIANTWGVARKDVDNWFIDARKRIGWNAARKAHFLNKRVDIVAAATRFYANDEKLSLSQGAEHALISIMKNAKDLYCDKFDETILVTKLAAAVKDLTPETKAEAKAERIRQAQMRKDRDSYPSPDRSPEPARLSPDSCDDNVDNIATQSIWTTSRKRRNSSAEKPAERGQDEESRPEKRTRLDTPPSSSETFPTGLPSPAPSVDEPLQATPPIDSSSPSFAPVMTSRKRRLSESDGQDVTKRPRHLSVAPRLQTVSDPLPLYNNLLFDETSFDGWFQQIFNRPEAGEVSPSGFSVELGNFSDFDCENPVGSRSTSPEFSEQTFEPPTLEVADVPIANVPWNEFDFGWTDDLSLSSNNLRQSNSLVNFVGQEPLPKPLAQDIVNFQVSSQISRPSNEFESFFGLSSPSVVDPVVISLNPVSNETWDFSESIVNRDDANFFEKHNGDLASNNGLLASLDFSQGADLLPSRDGIFLPTLPQDKVRQEKEKEFREAYEKAQRLALELQKDNLFA